jgi:hypothetical protein
MSSDLWFTEDKQNVIAYPCGVQVRVFFPLKQSQKKGEIASQSGKKQTARNDMICTGSI